MGIEQFHPAKRVWNFVQKGDFSISYELLSEIFTEQAKKESAINGKEHAHIVNLEIDNDTKVIHLNTDIYKLLEN